MSMTIATEKNLSAVGALAEIEALLDKPWLFDDALGGGAMVRVDQLREVLARCTATSNSKAQRAELLAAEVPQHTVDALYPTALQEMVHKVDNRRPGEGGYVTTRDEVIAILSEVSRSVPASVIERGLPSSMGDSCISVDITFGLTLERDDLR